jgi:hypothetical protein
MAPVEAMQAELPAGATAMVVTLRLEPYFRVQ